MGPPDLDQGELDFRRAEALRALARYDEALAGYEAVVAAQPAQIGAWYGRGMALGGLGRYAEAAAAMEAVVERAPLSWAGRFNLALAYEKSGRLQAALEQFLILAETFRTQRDEYIRALNQAARVATGLGQFGQAEGLLRRSLECDPHQDMALQDIARVRQLACLWPIDAPFAGVAGDAIVRAMDPVDLAAHRDDPGLQLALNARWALRQKAIPRAPGSHFAAGPRGRLRIGYVSADFREHPTTHLMYDVFGLHDRARVEVICYSIGPASDDPLNRHVRQTSDRYVDISDLDDPAACRRILDDGVDILVDLNGHTRLARAGIWAARPAPIIANWLGFPGTMGTGHHHYIIADDWTVPPENERFFSEMVLRLPCYQPSRRARSVSAAPITRAAAGLPEDGFVFCCFNGAWKITPDSFARWMTILGEVDNSVLWLLAPAYTRERLREHAATAGLDPRRLVFADWAPNPEHLARYRLADLFLDTGPYGAHTTASDALWMGTPVITLSGRSFASRVCGSLVRSAGLPDLVFTDAEAFVAGAIAIARDPARLARLRVRLAEGRDACTPFDTPLLVRSLEDLYRRMWDDYAAGALPKPDVSVLNSPLPPAP